jgi:hypothetical protein
MHEMVFCREKAMKMIGKGRKGGGDSGRDGGTVNPYIFTELLSLRLALPKVD